MRDDDKTIEEAYECGYEDGYEDAMEHSERAYRSRSRSYRMRQIMRLDARDRFPSGMEEYLAQNG